MAGLAAVEPDGGAGVGRHGQAEHVGVFALGGGEEAGEDGGGGEGERHAGFVEAGLYDGVVARVEVEVYGVAG